MHVDARATGANDGTSWSDAFTDLRSALISAGPDAQVWVAAGAYKPSATGDRTASFVTRDRQELYGGFAGTETTLADRAGLFHATILSGDLLGDDGPDFANTSDNSVLVLRMTYDTRVLDGFTITGGNGAGQWGGGVSVEVGIPRIENCTFRANRTDYEGGGLGAVFCDEMVVRHCVFVGNHSGLGGGGAAIYSMYYPVVFENCRFLGNSAAEGGGLYSFGPVDLIGCEFSGNVARRGGGISVRNPRLQNCTVFGNVATGSSTGGGLIVDSRAYVFGSILWGNRDADGDSDDAQIAFAEPRFQVVESNCIQGWHEVGHGNLAGDPRFLDAAGPDGAVGTVDDDFELSLGSPCVDTGDQSSPLLSLPPADWLGHPRRIDSLACDGAGVLDMGARERQVVDGTTSYCLQPPTSLGVPAELSAPCVVAIESTHVPFRVSPVASGIGILCWGSRTAATPFGTDTICIGGNLHRISGLRRTGNALELDLDLVDPRAAALVPGSTWSFQALFRDAGILRLSGATTITFRN